MKSNSFCQLLLWRDRQKKVYVERDTYICTVCVGIYLLYSFSCICAENSFVLYISVYICFFCLVSFVLNLCWELFYIYLIYTCAHVSFIFIYPCFFYIFVLSTLAYFVTHTPRRTWQLTLKTDRCWIVEFCAPTGTRWCLIMKAASTLFPSLSLSLLPSLFLSLSRTVVCNYNWRNYAFVWRN